MKLKTAYVPEDTSRSKLEASPDGVRAFVESAYGLSAHWGLYALSTGGTEWIYFVDRIPFKTYRERMKRFNPTRFNAEEWADLMVEAGHKFFMITSKHHDGFCLWDTALSDFNVARTPFKRDILAELSTALRDRGIALHFYYSLVDWTHPAYRKDWPAYVAYYQGQLRELCTRFGKIGGILFDGYWPRTEFDTPAEIEYFSARGSWDLAGTYDLIHGLQPDAVITNNAHILPTAGEDYQVSELDLPGESTLWFNCREVGTKPTACWWNLNSGWSYQPWNHSVKPAAELIDVYKRLKARKTVFLLNVGPRPFGDIHPEEQAVLRAMGRTIREYRGM